MHGGVYRGRTVTDSDPAHRNRVRVVVEQLGVDAWAEPCFPPGTSVITPAPGQGVWVVFEGGDKDHPVWIGVWR